jgi:hypothetical protein
MSPSFLLLFFFHSILFYINLRLRSEAPCRHYKRVYYYMYCLSNNISMLCVAVSDELLSTGLL